MKGAGIRLGWKIAMALAAPSALAQVEQANNDLSLDEIVVTAQRTESLAQRTPIALTVYSGDELRDAGITNIASLAAIDPSINFTASNGTAYVAIRGIASTDVTEIGDPSVPIARDGFFMNRSYSIQSSMYDLSRVEVLKGPQGTLEGRNSTGGVISIITAKPSKKDEAYVTLDVGNYSTTNAEFAGNWAASDELQLRLSGIYRKHTGYRALDPVGGHGDDEDMDSFRLQAAFEPFAAFTGWVSFQRDDTNDVGDVALTTAPVGARPDFGDADRLASYAPTRNKLLENRARWEFQYDLPADLGIIYSGGYDRTTWRHLLDATSPAYLDPFGGAPGYPAIDTFAQQESPDTWNHELRLVTRGTGPLQFQGGFFYFQETNELAAGLLNLQMSPPFGPGGPFSALSQVGVFGIHFNYKVHTRSDAVFGQLSYALNDQWKISAGARLTEDRKERSGEASLFLPALVSPFAPPVAITTPDNGKVNETQPTYHAGIEFTPTAQNLLYAKFDTGYKSGGFNSNGSAPSLPYGPEKLKSIELGSKNRFFENRLELNASTFYFDYKGYQASQNTTVLSGGGGVFNVGSAKIYGLELQAAGISTTLGRIDANIALLHTRFGEGIVVADGAGTARDIGGHQLPNAPKFVTSAGYQYDLPVGTGKLTPRVEAKYSARFYYSVFNDYDTESLPSLVGNFSLKYAPGSARWEAQAYIRNFTDRVVLTNAARNYVAFANTYEFEPPRTFGVMGTVRF